MSISTLGQNVRFTYDANGNVLTHVDEKGQTTTYTHNTLSKPLMKRDALNQLESYIYEQGGKLSRRTDRKGQVSGVTYDGHGRPIKIGFGATTAAPTTYASTVTLTWDKGDRLTQINDSAYGTITREYDGLDRVTKETSPQGQVSYTYDAAGRRKTMTVLGQPKLTYTYDNADRLTQIVQDAGPSNNNIAQTVKFSYDNDNRRTQVTLANGTKINTTYDNADQITAISYTKADGTSLGNLTYSYDGKGRRTGVGGTLSSTELPSAVTDPLYDANNRLTRWNGKTFQYDANGNLINDGERSYSWNARDELQGLGGTQSASFRYDPLGRRSAKTISTTTTGYLYDGLDFVQELAGTTSTSAVRANLITGGLDEPLLRITGTGSTATLSHFFSDANNNVIALTDSTQAIATKYSYGAYGQSKQTTVTGTTNTNSQQYTGRENDGTGLMYYRARYYHVGCARFISEDPIGWASGQTNNYAYVGGDPISLDDPLGLMPGDCYGESAAEWWAEKSINSEGLESLGYDFMGVLASLWTPETSADTAMTLFGGYAFRALGPLSPKGLPKPVARLRKYLRLDRPSHQYTKGKEKGWEFDGTIPKALKRAGYNPNALIPLGIAVGGGLGHVGGTAGGGGCE